MGLDLTYDANQTLLEEEEREGLLIPTVATRAELNELEQQNIEDAMQLALTGTPKAEHIFTQQYICNLHQRMYGDVWRWAGKFRKSNKNLGVDKWQIATALRTLLDDACYWVAEGVYSPEEMAVRFKHRLVVVHCFPDGNGRHSRLMADIIISKIYQKTIFTWGSKRGDDEQKVRVDYIKALWAANEGNYAPLLLFARS
jgi:Fic-DOC domain mobile mystery protein B